MMLKIVFFVILVASCYSKKVKKPLVFAGSSYYIPLDESKTEGKHTTTSVAVDNTKCTTRSAGWSTSSTLALQAGLSEGQKNVGLDVTIPGLACKHVGLKAVACDDDFEPLIIISKDMNSIDIFRNGISTKEIKVDVLLQCKEPLKSWMERNDLQEKEQDNLVDFMNDDSYERKLKPAPQF